MIRRCLVLVLATAAALALDGCDRTASSPATPAPETAASPIPEIDLSEMQAPVARAIGAARGAVAADPMSAEGWGGLGTVLDAHHMPEDAARCYRRAHELDPTDFKWPYFLAIVGDHRGVDTDTTLALFDAAEAIESIYPPLHARKADVLLRAGRLDEAEAAYRDAIRLNPRMPIAHRGLGQLLLARGDVRGAIEQLEAVIRMRDGDRGTYAALAQAYLRVGNEAAALDLSKRATTLSNRLDYQDELRGQHVGNLGVSSVVVIDRARFMMRNGAWALALQDLELAEEMLPDDAWVQTQLAEVHRRLGNEEAAQRHADEAARLRGPAEEAADEGGGGSD